MNGKNWIFGTLAAVGCAAALLAPRPAAAHCDDWGGYSDGWHSRHSYWSAYYDGGYYSHRPYYGRTVVVYRTVPVYRRRCYRHRYYRHHYRHVTRVYVSAYGGGWHARHRYGCY